MPEEWVCFLLRSEISFSSGFHPWSDTAWFTKGSVSCISQHIRWLQHISYKLFWQVWYQRQKNSYYFGAVINYSPILQSGSQASSELVMALVDAHKDRNTCCTPSPGSLILPVVSTVPLSIAAGILSVPVKVHCVSRAWHFVSSERQGHAFLLDPSVTENKVNLIVLEQMASFHVVAFPWLNGAWLYINIKCSYMWIYNYSNKVRRIYSYWKNDLFFFFSKNQSAF